MTEYTRTTSLPNEMIYVRTSDHPISKDEEESFRENLDRAGFQTYIVHLERRGSWLFITVKKTELQTSGKWDAFEKSVDDIAQEVFGS